MKSGPTKIVDTNGCEFGYELIMVLPYVHYLHQNNFRVSLTTAKGMDEFYYFLPEEQLFTKYNAREWEFPHNTELKDIHYEKFPAKQWLSPNYRERFKNYDYDLINIPKEAQEKPFVMISNKYTKEWLNPPTNFLSIETLETLFELLSPHYTVFYNRPRPKSVPQDRDQEHFEFNDWQLIKDKYPQVLDLNELVIPHEYNLAQLAIGAKCTKFISVQGGTSIISSLFGGDNLVYSVKGKEIEVNSYSWYNEFAGTHVRDFRNYDDIIKVVKEEWIES